MKLLNLLLSLIIISYTGNKVRVTFGGSCLEQDKITFNHGKIVNICTIYEISVADSNDNYPTLEKCVFGAVKWTENDDIGNINILDIVFDLIDMELFHFLLVDLVTI